MRTRITLKNLVGSLVCLLLLSTTATADTLSDVRDRGYVKCAIGNRPVGDTRIGETGWEGYFPEFCRVIALALFNDRNAVQLSPTLIRFGLESIAEGEVDVYISNVTWTFSRDMTLQLTPVTVLYYDGQGFLSYKGKVPGKLAETEEVTVCVSRATTTIGNLEDFIAYHGLSWRVLPFESTEGRNDAFFSRQCDLLTADRLVLASLRTTAVDEPQNYVLHDEVISKEPLVAYVSAKDMIWGNLARWAMFATILAEEKGITRDNIEDFLSSDDPSVRRLLGVDPTPGSEAMGLPSDWARNVIAGAGNFGEIYDRYLGRDSDMKIPRGANRLWSDGGLIYSPPFR